LKIVTWNCSGAFRKKFSYLKEYDADIYIIQECENPKALLRASEEYYQFALNSIWAGNNKNKGLGIFVKNNVSIEKLVWNHDYHGRILQWFLPIRVNDKFNIVAVWNHHAEAKAFAYIGQFWLFMQNNKSLLKNTIICGDFNSNKIWDSWDRWWNHSDCVRELSEMNIFSIYHENNNVEPGTETQKTFYLQKNAKKGYHIDYIFADKKYIKRTKHLIFGSFNKWKDKSDHVPMLWEFEKE
jgi:endonuclease/exonuclease/phosphatase family metal-dependent hydrolase